MFLKIGSHYSLRGWKGASCGLVDTDTNHVTFYRPEAFNILLLADGITSIDESILTNRQRAILQQLIQDNTLEICPKPSPISQEQKYKAYDNRFVRSVLWSVTGKCNCRCRHCYMDAPKGALGEISHDEALSFIDQMAECGILRIMLTGGEPLVRPDIYELIAYLTKKNIKITQIYTNGQLVNESLLDLLDSLEQKPEFNFSFDGIGWHDWMRGIPGIEQTVLNAIKLCQDKGFPTGAEVCLHKGNLKSLRETINLLGSLNTPVKVGGVSDTDLWRQNSEGNSLSFEDYLDATIQYIPQFFEDGMPADLLIGSVIELNKGSYAFRVLADKHDGTDACLTHRLCNAARMTAYITPEGRLLPCLPMTSWSKHNCFERIQDIGLKAGLTDDFYMNFVNGRIQDLLNRNEKCNSCEYRLRCCGGCRASALMEENDLYGCDPFQCYFWKNGYEAKIRTAAKMAVERFAQQ